MKFRGRQREMVRESKLSIDRNMETGLQRDRVKQKNTIKEKDGWKLREPESEK